MGRALGFNQKKDLLCLGHHLVRDSGQTGHLNTIAFVGASGYKLTEKDDVIVELLDCDVEIFYPGLQLLQPGKLMVVGGKQSLDALALEIMEMFGNGPGNAHSVKGGGAPSYLIQNYKAFFTGIVDDVGCLLHLHHEGALSLGEVV